MKMEQSALSRLQAGELCIVVLQDGMQREGAWSPNDQNFNFTDGKSSGSVPACDVYEWWPASAGF